MELPPLREKVVGSQGGVDKNSSERRERRERREPSAWRLSHLPSP